MIDTVTPESVLQVLRSQNQLASLVGAKIPDFPTEDLDLSDDDGPDAVIGQHASRGGAAPIVPTLIRHFSQLGLTITQKQAGLLSEIYGAAGKTAPIALQDMLRHGVLSTTVRGDAGLTWSVNWPAISPQLAADAVHRLGSDGKEPGFGLSAKQFARGVDQLLGHPGALARNQASQIVRVYGQDGKITRDQIPQTFDLRLPGSVTTNDGGPIKLVPTLVTGAMPVSVGPVGLHPPHQRVDGTKDWSPTRGAMVNYLMSFSGNNGHLSKTAFMHAVGSMLGAGTKLESSAVDLCMAVYSSTNSHGTSLSHADIVEMVEDDTLAAGPRAAGGYGFVLNASKVPLDRVVQQASDARMATKITALLILPTFAIARTVREQAIVAQRIFGKQGSDDEEADESDDDGSGENISVGEGARHVFAGLGLNATIFGNLMIDHDRLMQRKRPRLGDLKGVDLSKIPAVEVAQAIFRQAGKDPKTERLATADFERAVQDLVGDEQALGRGAAEMQVRLANTPMLAQGQPDYLESISAGGTSISFDGVVTIFERKLVEILSGSEEKAVVVQDNHIAALADPGLLFEFLQTFGDDRIAGLDDAEILTALTSFSFAGLATPEQTSERLSILLGRTVDGRRRLLPDTLHKAVAAGVIAPCAGPDGSLQVDLSKIPTTVVVDAMFYYFQLLPERDSLTAEQFDEAIERVSGHRRAISALDVDYLVKEYASDIEGGTKVLTQPDIVSIFDGDLSLGEPVDGSTLPIGNHIDPKYRSPAYTNPATWQTGFSLAGPFANDLALALAPATGLAVRTVIKIMGRIGSWELLNPEAGAKVHAALQKTWSAEGSAVPGAVGSLIARVTGDPKLMADTRLLLEESLLQIKAHGTTSPAFLHLFWTEKTSVTEVLNTTVGLQLLHRLAPPVDLHVANDKQATLSYLLGMAKPAEDTSSKQDLADAKRPEPSVDLLSADQLRMTRRVRAGW